MNAKDIKFLVVPSNDGETIFEKMLGIAMYFQIYRINPITNEIKFVESRKNPYQQTQQHLKNLNMYYLLNDCRIILAANIGKKGIQRLNAKGVELIFKKGNIYNALNEIVINA